MSTAPIQITGNLTRDPELQYLPTSGRPVARFGVAVNSRRRTEAGEWVDGKTTYYHCSAWGELAEHTAEPLTRGARVVVLGQIGVRSWNPHGGRARRPDPDPSGGHRRRGRRLSALGHRHGDQGGDRRLGPHLGRRPGR